jgi:hypothetical protein
VFAFSFSGSSDHRPLPPGRIMTSWKINEKKKMDGKNNRRKQEEIYLKMKWWGRKIRKKNTHSHRRLCYNSVMSVRMRKKRIPIEANYW